MLFTTAHLCDDLSGFFYAFLIEHIQPKLQFLTLLK